MPTYEYKCSNCNRIEEQTHSIKETPEFKCPDCKNIMDRLISRNMSGFTFGKAKTTVIHQREKEQRKKKSAIMKEKQANSKRFHSPIQPNVAGMEVDSWSDAQKVAKEAGMNTESYQPWVDKEKSHQLIKKL